MNLADDNGIDMMSLEKLPRGKVLII